jgi:hypothetical protein
MILDALGKVMAAQAFTAVAVSASSVDLGNPTVKREIATGEPMGFGLNVDVAASSTTVLVEIIQATDDVLTAGIVVLSQRTFLSADMPVGALIFLPLPQGVAVAGPLRYLGLRVTPAGGAATVTLSGYLMPHNLWAQKSKIYSKGYVVTG